MGIMIGNAVKSARIESHGSPLGAFWAASTRQAASIMAAIVRLNPARARSKRAAGRHAAPRSR